MNFDMINGKSWRSQSRLKCSWISLNKISDLFQRCPRAFGRNGEGQKALVHISNVRLTVYEISDLLPITYVHSLSKIWRYPSSFAVKNMSYQHRYSICRKLSNDIFPQSWGWIIDKMISENEKLERLLLCSYMRWKFYVKSGDLKFMTVVESDFQLFHLFPTADQNKGMYFYPLRQLFFLIIVQVNISCW